ncbi:Trk system potassium uptake protein TrkI [bacterium HR40]|nr:Trk system potassium uptake protein TrkI [bacterium HR40]
MRGQRMQGLGTVVYALGWQLVVFALAMLVPLGLDFAVGSADWQAFAASAAISLFLGGSLLLAARGRRHELPLRAAFLLTVASWVVISVVGSLPLQFGSYRLSLTDAIFETVSGLTTTGATVVVGLDQAPPGFLLWRALLHWIGGIGIVVMALVLLPFLRIGGMQLFRSESSDRAEKVLPTTAGFVARLLFIYIVLTALLTTGLMLCGLSFFDSLSHAFAAVATGGFSTRDASIGAFREPAVEVVLIFGMLAACLPYSRYVALTVGRPGLLVRDSQVRWFLFMVAAATAFLALWLVLERGREPLSALRAAAFAVTSIVTTTGFVAEDWSAWSANLLPFFLILTVVGGCTGSTAGGIKIFRFEILSRSLLHHLARLASPRRIIPLVYDGRLVEAEVVRAVAGFVFVFALSWGVFAILLGLCGLDVLTALSAAATALANVGPGLGDIVGPAGNYRPLSDTAKWILIFAMLLGRLEFFTVLVLLHPRFWKW